LQYKEFLQKGVFNHLVLGKEEGYKFLLVVEVIVLPLLKVIFKYFFFGGGVTISSGKDSLKGSLSLTQFNLSRLIFSVFNASAYKITTQSFYNYRFINIPVRDLTEQNLELFIKMIILDETISLKPNSIGTIVATDSNGNNLNKN
jgi:hypothetical protein